MSFLTDASLVFIPSGYKEDKAYSIKPTDGSGDLTFARASDGTRVNSEGYVERVPWNLLQYSEQFDNGTWSKTAVSVGSSTSPNPVNGLLTAKNIVPSVALSSHRILQTINGLSSQQNTWSVYAKANGYNFITIVENANTGANVSFNLSSGTIGQQNSATGQIETLGNGWYRCSMVHTIGATARFDIYVSPTDSISAYAGDGTSGVILFGAQANEGTLKPYFPTTNRQDVPRLDYSNGCPCLLLEPQRTNLALYSEQLNQWSLISATVTTDIEVAPNGITTADKVVAPSGRIQQNFTLVNGTNYVASIYAKAESGNIFNIQNIDGVNPSVQFNLSSVSVTNSNGGVGTIESVGNGWYRCSMSFTSALSGTNYLRIITSTDGIYAWGAQLEAGSYPTSYIPTTSASVTRVADAASKTGISDLIGQSEGTIFLDFVFDGLGTEQRLGISDGTSANYNNIRITTGGTLYVLGAASSVLQYEINCASLSIGNRYKVALAYKQNDIIVYLNGSNVGSDNSATIGACSRFGFDNRDATSVPFRSPINQALLFKTRLTNDQLEYLTGNSYSTYATMASQLNYTIQ